jgi:aspartyl aminopeptidase
LDLKPRPLCEKNDLAFFKTHYYGGIKKYQWTALPLSLHGRIIKKNGEYLDLCIGENPGEPQFCITDLLPHLAGEQMAKTLSKGIQGEDLNILIGSRPFRDDQESDLVKLNIMRLLHETYGLVESDFISAELELVPAFKAAHIGFDRSMVGAYGQDDRVCAYPALSALLACDAPEYTVMTVWADKEEIGSNGNTGMQSAWLPYFIAQLAKAEGSGAHQVLSRSKCLSADVGAAYDPAYSDVYEAGNACYLNQGVLITKYTGSGGKSNTSDASAEFVGEIRQLLDQSEVLWQTGELGKVDAGGGGTIAKFIANLNVDVVDLGVPVLSMHSPFEIVSKLDVYMMHRALSAFFGKA